MAFLPQLYFSRWLSSSHDVVAYTHFHHQHAWLLSIYTCCAPVARLPMGALVQPDFRPSGWFTVTVTDRFINSSYHLYLTATSMFSKPPVNRFCHTDCLYRVSTTKACLTGLVIQFNCRRAINYCDIIDVAINNCTPAIELRCHISSATLIDCYSILCTFGRRERERESPRGIWKYLQHMCWPHQWFILSLTHRCFLGHPLRLNALSHVHVQKVYQITPCVGTIYDMIWSNVPSAQFT